MAFIAVSFAVFRLQHGLSGRGGAARAPYLCPSTLSIFDFVAAVLFSSFFTTFFAADCTYRPHRNKYTTFKFIDAINNFGDS